MIERFEKFSFYISEISRYWHKIASEEMEKYGLKGPHSVYLLALARYPEGLTAPRLCEVCGKDKADVSRMMSIMEKKGLVVKEGTNNNLYGGKLILTEEGKNAVHFVKNRVALVVDMAGKDLTDEKRNIFYEALESIAINLQKISEAGLPTEETD